MDTVCYFSELEDEQLYLVTGGCGFCVAGTIIGCAATGVSIGGAVGTIVGIMIAF